MIAAEYVTAGLVLVPIPRGKKGPEIKGWNLRRNCIETPEQAAKLNGHNIGLAHVYSRTCAVDVDDFKTADAWLSERGIDLAALLMADDAVQISSGREGRAKLLYRLPAGVESLTTHKIENALELRCAASNGLSVQDVLPPSIHPDTGKPYQWKGTGDWRRIPELPAPLLELWRKLDAKPKDKGDGGEAFDRRSILDGVPEGERDDKLFRYACSLQGRGVEQAEAETLVRQAAANCSPPFPEAAALDKVRRVYGKYGEPEPTALEASEDELALSFSHKHVERLRYVAKWGHWYEWCGQRWAEDETVHVFDLVRAHCRDAVAPLKDKAKRKAAAKAATVAAVERLARADRRHAATVGQWDQDEWILNTPAGMVDLKTGEIRSHDPERYITKITAVSPDGDCHRWRQFLGEVTEQNIELIDFLQRLVGYCLTGSTREHAFAFFYGTGANGKGTFLNTVTAILGDYATTAPVDVFTESNSERHPTELAMLRGARLVQAQETEEGRRWAESRIKALTGGDPITARFMRQDFFTFTPAFKLIVAGNHKPALRNIDEAMRRRLLLVPFTVTIPKADRDLDLAERLRGEWPGILHWMVEGCLDYQREGLWPPDCVQAATSEYFSAQDIFRQWIEDCCDTGPNCWEPPTRLFNAWRRYAEAAHEPAGSKPGFADKLLSAGFEPGSARSRGGRYWQGIRFKLNENDWRGDVG
jgi:P4 family phage/plasmid primase-like protien